MTFPKGKIYYEFDVFRFEVVEIECLGVNNKTDGWVRFRYLEYDDDGITKLPNKDTDRFTSLPQSSYNSGFFDTELACITGTIDKILERNF